MSRAWEYIGYIFVIGAIAMALLQIINEFSPLREGLQTHWLKAWMQDRINRFMKAKNGPQEVSLPDIDLNVAMSQLISHATSGDSHAFFSLVTNQFVGQINAAAQIAIDDARENFALLAVLAQPSMIPVFSRSIKLAATSPEQNLKDLAILFSQPEGATSSASETRYLEARNRVAHRIQRNLDNIQINFSRYAARADIIVSLAIGVVAGLFVFSDDGIELWTRIEGGKLRTVIEGSGLWTGIAGGYLGPILNDVLLAIRRTGRP